jgi:transcriptional regulator with XRE-family HTH domain
MSEHPELVRLGTAFRQARERDGISVAELAARTGVDAQQIDGIEAGRLDPAFDVMCALADGFGVRLSALFQEG